MSTEFDQPFYLTTPIYYASDLPHLGHAYTTIVGDTLARYQRIRRGADRVFYLTGMDEHGEKIERAATAQGCAPQTFVDGLAHSYQALWKQLHIQYDDFIRTTEPRHKEVVQQLWNQLWNQGDIYQGEYEGWYCVACESFYPEKDLLPGGLCPDHKKATERVKEAGYFFRLSNYEARLLDWYQRHPDFVEPSMRLNEVAAFVRSGLKDLSISRSSFRWGIPVPHDPSQVIYVWIDALTNYWSALQNPPERQQFWGTQDCPHAIHLVGKEISRFHAVYWPAMLMALGLPLPRKIVAHGWWTVEGEKMSKTTGNVVQPQNIASDIGADALRYFVLREIPLGQDGDFSYKALITRYNSELANDLGNLLSRTLSMTEKFSEGKALYPPETPVELQNPYQLRDQALVCKQQIEAALADLQPAAALTALFDLVRCCNAYLEQQAPFKLAKSNPTASQFVLYQTLEALRWIGMFLAPFMPERAAVIRLQLGLQNSAEITWPNTWGDLPRATLVRKGDPLFPRLDPDQQAALLAKWLLPKQAVPVATPASGKPLVSYSTFQQIDLRVGHVLSAERVPKKDKLLKLTVDLGHEQRTVVAGIAARYSPEQLVGRSVVMVANLEPAKIGGIVSQGMLLAVGDQDIIGLVQPDAQAPAGSTVR